MSGFEITSTTTTASPFLWKLRGGEEQGSGSSPSEPVMEESTTSRKRTFGDEEDEDLEEDYDDEEEQKHAAVMEDEEEDSEGMLEDYDMVSMHDDDETELEDEEHFIMEEVVYEEIAPEEEEGVEDTEALVEESDLEDEETAPTRTTQEVLERATAGFHTDDENSSAFVDRMELADAYDLEETVTGEEQIVMDDAQAMAAVTAATAVGAGGSDLDSIVEERPAATEEEDGELAVEEITDEMKEILVQDLKFRPADIKVLRPEIASMIIANRLQKPREGMPANWYLPGSAKSGVSPLRKRIIKASATILAVGAVALVAKGQDIDLDDIADLLKKIPATLAAIPAALMGSSSSSEGAKLDEKTSPADSVVEEGEEDSSSPTEEEDDHPHSLKPGSSYPPTYEEDLDKTALDKIITKIENGFKSFFRMKI